MQTTFQRQGIKYVVSVMLADLRSAYFSGTYIPSEITPVESKQLTPCFFSFPDLDLPPVTTERRASSYTHAFHSQGQNENTVKTASAHQRNLLNKCFFQTANIKVSITVNCTIWTVIKQLVYCRMITSLTQIKPGPAWKIPYCTTLQQQ